MLRRPERGYSEPALQRFLDFLDVLPPLHGQVSKKWVAGLGDIPTRCWSCWRRGSFEDRMQLHRQLLPRFARILGEPYPDHVEELLVSSRLTLAQMPTWLALWASCQSIIGAPEPGRTRVAVLTNLL